jgi:hypothetical protein
MHIATIVNVNGSLLGRFRANRLPWMFLALALAASPVAADPIVVPTSLNPGDQYRLVFLTTATTTGNSDLISVYNTHVTNAATGRAELAALRKCEISISRN